ncbi:cation:proton antiporter domain-containing protein [Lacticaseibacillus saniviri]
MANIALLIVFLAALVIPLLLARFHITRVPTAVAEIIIGMALGPSLLHLVSPNATLNQLSSLGVVVLLFLSGMEIDFDLFKPQKQSGPKKIGPAKLAIIGYAAVLLASAAFSFLLKWLHLFDAAGFATIVFATVALGVVIAALKEKELLSQPFGQTILLIAALGEVIPLISLTVYAAIFGSSDKSVWLLSIIFVVAIVLLLRFRRPYQLFAKIDKSTTQLDIRLAFFIIITLVTVAEQVGAESILGAFLAGMFMKLLRPREETRDKLTSLGYGFFIPIFFIMTGVKINLPALLADRQSVLLIPVLLLGFIITKIVLIPVFRLRFKPRNALSGTALITTTITLVIPALTIGRNLDIITSQQAGAFTLAAIITCLLAPVIFSSLFVAEEQDFKRTVVHFIGANIITIPIAQQLSKGLYDISLYTDKQGNYSTYNSEANIKLLPSFSQGALNEAGAYEADIVVLGYFDHEKNYQLAQWALAAKVPRIIARFETKDVQSQQFATLADEGVEIFNTLDANISLLRSLIESPSTMKILTDTKSGIFEITVRNRRFAGLEIKDLPFVDHITISQIYRDGQFVAPHGDTQIYWGDHIIFSGDKNDIQDLRQELEKIN